MTVVTTVTEMQAWADAARRSGKRIGFVPTMGYLHEGHLSLVRIAQAKADLVVVSIFVNPLQFGPTEDLAVYPRDFERDRKLLVQEKVDVIFHPNEKEMYTRDFSTHVAVEKLAEGLCGATRPGHFQGVCTVVAKLFNAVKPHVAVFGAKDAQQAYVIKRMTGDLDFGIEILVGPTVREADGLAMSSRNRYLSPSERAQAPVLFRALQHGAALVAKGERSSEVVTNAIAGMVTGADNARVDYVSVVDTATLQEVATIAGEVLIALAVFFGKTRLIDNVAVNPLRQTESG